MSDPRFLLQRLEPLRQRILAGSNEHCFIERQELLLQAESRLEQVPPQERYALVLEYLLDHLSTPIAPEDVFVGRMVEGPWNPDAPFRRSLPCFVSPGHTTLDWPALLTEGLNGVARRISHRAGELNTAPAGEFARSVERCSIAIVRFARRYADAARATAATVEGEARLHLLLVAEALERSPAGPAPDFFTALQGIWLVQLVMSCVIGARDFAFGRLDQYLLPLYEKGVRDGSLTPERARCLLAHLFVKSKEITGTATDNHRTKPTPCHASNQYLVIGGVTPAGAPAANEVSLRVLEAVELAKVPQPEINVRLSAGAPELFRQAAARAVQSRAPQVQFWNDEAILEVLARDYPRVTVEDARDYALTACNRINFPGKEYISAGEHWHVMPRWLLAALDEGRDPVTGEGLAEGIAPSKTFVSLDDLLVAFGRIAVEQVGRTVKGATEAARVFAPEAFHFESALLRDCDERCLDVRAGGIRYPTQFHLFAGVATVADSLAAIQSLVFEEQRLSLPELVAIARRDFAGEELLRLEIRHRLPRFGNDDPRVDGLARRVSLLALEALDAAPNPDRHLLFPALYSLHHHVPWGRQLPATPDGRLAGEPLSENQSPAHGADRAGLSALLRSVACLPHERTVMGGLNVRFGGRLEPAEFLAVLDAFFAMGGVTVGYTEVDRATLLAARTRPEEHRDLCVRVTGFSEYFVALSPEGQQDLIERTVY